MSEIESLYRKASRAFEVAIEAMDAATKLLRASQDADRRRSESAPSADDVSMTCSVCSKAVSKVYGTTVLLSMRCADCLWETFLEQRSALARLQSADNSGDESPVEQAIQDAYDKGFLRGRKSVLDEQPQPAANGSQSSLECDHCGDVAIFADNDGLFTDGDGGTCGSCGFPGHVSCDSETPAEWCMSDEDTVFCTRADCDECNERKKESAQDGGVDRSTVPTCQRCEMPAMKAGHDSPYRPLYASEIAKLQKLCDARDYLYWWDMGSALMTIEKVRAETIEECADLCEGRPEGRSCAAAIRRIASAPPKADHRAIGAGGGDEDDVRAAWDEAAARAAKICDDFRVDGRTHAVAMQLAEEIRIMAKDSPR